MQLCFATNNAHKIEEVQAILGVGFSLVSLRDVGCTEELPEEQSTLAGNSFQKAEYVFNQFHVSCFADDSGLEVDALGNAPGVHTAHYAGLQRNAEDNMAFLLKNLNGVNNRKARFKTVITLMQPGSFHQFEGILRGVILNEKRGSGGFGYDPLFLPENSSKTLAEMTLDEKNKLSHRAMAVHQLAGFLRENPAITTSLYLAHE